ncbi:MAG: acyl-CoA dehydrogenase C-terminal domain-containing protein, partial [Pseudomonadota bacterium]
ELLSALSGEAASKGLENASDADKPFYSGKLAATKFFFNYELPKIKADLEVVASLDDTCYELNVEEFTGS